MHGGHLSNNVYFFTNEEAGGGPLGFQPDVFDTEPGDEKYRPLRTVNLLTWEVKGEARLLSSAYEIKAASATIRRDPGNRVLIVVNVRHCHHIRPALRKEPGVSVVRHDQL